MIQNRVLIIKVSHLIVPSLTLFFHNLNKKVFTVPCTACVTKRIVTAQIILSTYSNHIVNNRLSNARIPNLSYVISILTGLSVASTMAYKIHVQNFTYHRLFTFSPSRFSL